MPAPAIVSGPGLNGQRSDSPARFTHLTIADLFALPPPTWIVSGLLQAESLAVLYGPPGGGKSFLALGVGLSIASGLPWCGREVKRSRVVYCCGEGIGGLSKRVQAWGDGQPLDAPPLALCAENFFVIPQVPRLLDLSEVTAFLSYLKKLNPQPCVVAFDTLARGLVGGDENSAADMGKAIQAMDAIRRQTGATVWGVHHCGKDGERGARGSSALLGACDTMLSLKPDGKDIILTTEKQKDSEAAPRMTLRLE